MNRFLLVIIFILGILRPASAIVDSSAIVLHNEWSSSDKIRWMNDYSVRMLNENNIIFAEKSALLALKLSEETHFDFGKAKANIHLGEVEYNKKSYKQAENYFQEALKLFAVSGDKLNLARAQAMKAEACFMQNKLDSALIYNKEALAQFELGIIDDNLLATIHKRTGDIYCGLDATDKAGNEYDNTIKVYADILKDNKKASETAFNIGSVLLSFDHREEALVYFNVAERYLNQIADTIYTAELYFNLSKTLESISENDLAIKIAEKSLKNYAALADTTKMVENLAWLGWLNALTKNNKTAEANLGKAEMLSNKFSDKKINLSSYGLMGRSYEKLGDKTNATKFYGLFASGSQSLQNKNKLKFDAENILDYDDVQFDAVKMNQNGEPIFENRLSPSNSKMFFRFFGLFLMFGSLVVIGLRNYKPKFKTRSINNSVATTSPHLTLNDFDNSNQPIEVINENQNQNINNNLIDAPKSENNPTLDVDVVKINSIDAAFAESKETKSPSSNAVNIRFNKVINSPKEILELIGGHIEQIKRLQKDLFDKQIDENHKPAFQSLKNSIYELQVLIDNIHASIRLNDSTILNTETFFAPNDVVNYVKEQLNLPARISVAYNIDARLPSLLIGNGMVLSQIIAQSIKGLSKPMIDGALKVNLTRSEIVADEITLKLDIEAIGTGFIFDRLEKIINSDQKTQSTTDESESALLFVKKLVKSKNDDLFLHRNDQKTILTAFLTFEIPIPNYLSLTEVHPSLLPKTEMKIS